ncbi:hypothetical protein Agub_g681, partial [Astrephomene gubernaculifera]
MVVIRSHMNNGCRLRTNLGPPTAWLLLLLLSVEFVFLPRIWGPTLADAAAGAAATDTPLPPSRCPGSCTLHGTCNEELGRCDCPRHLSGPDCSRRLPRPELLQRCRQQGYSGLKECLDPEQSCLNRCNRRGSCVAGFCHCKPGHFGADCSLSLDSAGRPVLLAGSGYSTRTKRPWVYVYELPPEMTVWYNFRRLDRPLHLLLWQRLLSSGARVADGAEADYYLLPVRQRSFSDSPLLEAAMRYSAAHWPWWNGTGGGHRHLVLHTGDWGRAEASPEVQLLGWNMSWLTHWGLTKDRDIPRWSRSFRPDKDVVLPVYISPGHFVKFGMTRSPLHPRLAARAAARNRTARTAATLFFAGRICPDQRYPTPETWPHCGGQSSDNWYSGGIREKVVAAHWSRPGFHLVASEPRYGAYLAGSTYCLAPPGAGHGQRQIQALFMGCVPVTVADHVAEPFEPALSWQRWGVRAAEADIPRLHELLAGVGEEQLAGMRSRMHCAAQHMLYSSISGGLLGEDGRYDAFESALEVLRVRGRHPGEPQARFGQLDADFAEFMS